MAKLRWGCWQLYLCMNDCNVATVRFLEIKLRRVIATEGCVPLSERISAVDISDNPHPLLYDQDWG